eukprot:gnl/MRDRNA2_/MRDRNA2_58633_c0_seq1.p1 gnl/MRDRNA2_/MRDRNA2_58633_c0~~gnl/MRDRNA2_/MRDRNA2_58633_c0_seq1.p1  ORF type:complete len:813 (+),score=185.03 gnl/MRDRNA2_/MRDRNA2_58633_c0_seq1:44-2440(+)
MEVASHGLFIRQSKQLSVLAQTLANVVGIIETHHNRFETSAFTGTLREIQRDAEAASLAKGIEVNQLWAELQEFEDRMPAQLATEKMRDDMVTSETNYEELPKMMMKIPHSHGHNLINEQVEVAVDDHDALLKKKQSVLQWSHEKHAVLEGNAYMKLVVQRTGDVTKAVTVDYNTRDGTAFAGLHYHPAKGKLEFAAGETEKEIAITTFDDVAWEEDINFFCDLSNPTAAGEDELVVIGEIWTASVTIIDDDEPGTLFITQEEMECVEKGEDFVLNVMVERKMGCTGTVACKFHTENDSAIDPRDFEATEGELIFKEGQMSALIPITIKARGRYDGKKMFRVVISDPSGGAKFDDSTDGGEEECICSVFIRADEANKQQWLLKHSKENEFNVIKGRMDVLEEKWRGMQIELQKDNTASLNTHIPPNGINSEGQRAVYWTDLADLEQKLQEMISTALKDLRSEQKVKHRAADVDSALEIFDKLEVELTDIHSIKTPAHLDSSKSIRTQLEELSEDGIAKDPRAMRSCLKTGELYIEAYVNLVRYRSSSKELHEKLSAGVDDGFKLAYEGVLRTILKGKEKASWELYQKRIKEVKAAGCEKYPAILERTTDFASRVMELYYVANLLKNEVLEPLLEKMPAGKPTAASLKRPWRLLEKEYLRRGAGLPWDVVRAHVECETMEGILQVLNALVEAKDIIILEVNDKFSSPKNGWADCSVYFMSSDPRYKACVGEIQIVHHKLMVLREQLGAHDAYDESRFLSELLKQWSGLESDALPWSAHKNQLKDELTRLVDSLHNEVEQ